MKKGIGGFTLKLMDDGPVQYTTQTFENRQATLGARIYSYGEIDSDNFILSALTRTLPDSINLWANYIRNPGFRADDLQRERALSLSALSRSLSDPGEMAQRTLTGVLYGQNHAYGVALGGRAEIIKSFTREDISAFHDRWIRPDNAIIYASGDTTLAVLVPALEKAFGDWKAPATLKGTKSIDTIPPETAPRIILIYKPGAVQSVIQVGQIVPAGLDGRAFNVDAMNGILGGNFTSRLNMNLREAKGWTYGVNSGVGDARGPQIFAVATNIQTDKTSEALTEISKEVQAIRKDKPVTQQELDMLAKGEVLGLPGRFETNQAVVQYLEYVNRFDKPFDYIASLPGKYAALRPETVTSTASEILHPEALTWVIVGDLGKVEPKIRALHCQARHDFAHTHARSPIDIVLGLRRSTDCSP